MALKLAYTDDSDNAGDHWRVVRFTVSPSHKEQTGVDQNGAPVFTRINRIEVVVKLWKSKAAHNNLKHPVAGVERSYVWFEPDMALGNARVNNCVGDIETKLLTLPEFAGAITE